MEDSGVAVVVALPVKHQQEVTPQAAEIRISEQLKPVNSSAEQSLLGVSASKVPSKTQLPGRTDHPLNDRGKNH